ncbi:hypothetical protein [Streptomyces sp. Root369]|uniref:hypothetical protein n=1 Tax=Streptomyces sp. Root369 TaxID=1736523 RepID=UPI00070C9C17|nr:hypothetical protein [Streptomyces sp. Root369]KQW13577.1 hypothetical protein ASD08_30915 [Streptomyces sp. Root369]
MSTSVTLHCNTTYGFSTCAAQLITDGLTVEEARRAGADNGWRHVNGRDYCAACSGSKIKPRLVVAVNAVEPLDSRVRADLRLQTAKRTLLPLVNGATAGDWWYNPERMWNGPGLHFGEEFVAAGPVDRPLCVAGTGPADNPQSMDDAAYIAAVGPEVGRAITGVLNEAFETVHQEQGLVETSLTQAAVDLADAILRTKGEQ